MIDFTQPETIVSLVLGLLVFAIIDTFSFLTLKRTMVRVFIGVMEALILVSWIFSLNLVMIISVAALAVGLCIFFFCNLTDIRTWVSNNFKGQGKFLLFKGKGRISGEELFDREAMYEKIEDAVKACSRQKIGMLISFEKKQSLAPLVENGVTLNSPVSSELIQTIFYPGSRLHDLGMVIKGNLIVAANCQFPLTNSALTGKYGSRHRAALGVSEHYDCVTVIVSEETGRISIGYDGELIGVQPDRFLNVFTEYMSINKELDEAKE